MTTIIKLDGVNTELAPGTEYRFKVQANRDRIKAVNEILSYAYSTQYPFELTLPEFNTNRVVVLRIQSVKTSLGPLGTVVYLLEP